MTPITALGSRYGIQGALGRSVKRAAAGGTYTFYPTADTFLSYDRVYNNFGVSPYYWISGYNAKTYMLLRFDLSSIPSDATATAASIRFTMGSPTVSAYNITLDLRSVAAANGDWIEGTKKDALAGSGEPCHDAKEADGSGGRTTAWAGSVGCATSGTDYEANILGSVVQPRADPDGTQFTIDFNSTGLTRIAGWFGSGTTNYGIMLMPQNYVFSNVYSRQATTESYRPLLTITYS